MIAEIKKPISIVFAISAFFCFADTKGKIIFPAGYPEKKNTVVWVEGKESVSAPGHSRIAVIMQKDTKFVPFLTVVTSGSTLRFINADPHLHMIKSNDGPLKDFRTAMTPLKNRIVDHPIFSTGASELLCDIHAQMHAFVVVVPNDSFAISNDKGEFLIPGKLPSPPFTVKTWNEILPATEIQISSVKDLKKIETIALKTWDEAEN